MDYKALFVVTLIFLTFIPAPVASAEINPSVENQPFLCKYSVTKWLCKSTGGAGTINLPDEINITEFNSYFSNTTIAGDFYNNSNVTIAYTNITEATFNGDVWYYTYSEIPRMSSADMFAIDSPVEGAEVYDLTNHTKRVWNGTEWGMYVWV